MEQQTEHVIEQERESPAAGRRPKSGNRNGKGRLRRWVILAVVLTTVVQCGLFLLVMGRDGFSLVEGYLLARYAFIEADADVSGAVDDALNALVTGLGDRWSYYRDAEGHEELKTTRANNYVGVGITITYDREEGLYIQGVTPGGPAEKAGVLAGDIVIAVDGVSVAGEARYEGGDLIVGEEGSKVELTLLGQDGSTRAAVCTRATLRSPSASGVMLEGQIGYVRLSNFYTGAAESFREEVDALMEQGAESLVIDLRNDPGGYISELKEILDYLLPEGPVFQEQARWWWESVYVSDASCVDLPMVTLVNAHTYSAAELLAAQLRESVSAPVVGERTSGKGYSQITFALVNGGGLGLSVARYCMGSGTSLIGVGITPDVELSLAEDVDNQLAAAIALLAE